jgi:hypothetical protein
MLGHDVRKFGGKPMSTFPVTPAPARKKRGCFFYGCLTLVILTLLVCVAGFFAVRYALNRFTALIEQYTDAAPAALPPAELPAGDYEGLQGRLAEFQEVLEGRKDGPPLTLTSAELNALIANHAMMKEWKDRLRVAIDGDQVKAQLSLPLDRVAGLPFLSRLKGRYLNGSAVLKASLEDGLLDIHMVSLEAKGVRPPEEVMSRLRAENLAKDVQYQPEIAANLRKLNSLEVQDGVIMLRAKPPPASAPAE